MTAKLIIPVIASCGILLTGCGHNHDQHEKGTGDGHNHNQGEIVIEPADAQQFGVMTDTVTISPFNEAIHVSGQITNSTSDEAMLTASIPGIITIKPNISVGMQVKAGTTIANISAKKITGGNPEEAARVAVANAKRQLDRLEPLLKEGIVTRREYDEALAAYNTALAAVSPGASGTVSSPISGVITQLAVSTGQYVETGSPIAMVSRSNTLVLRADLPEKYRAMLPRITSATFRTPYGNEWIEIESLNGKRAQVETPDAQAKAGYIPVYFCIVNDGSLSAGAYIDMCLTGDSGEMAIAVPTTALSEQQGNYFVYVKTGEHSYKKRKVCIGESNGLMTRIDDGLSEGETIVVKGTTIVKLAESSGAVPEGHSHSH